MFHLNLVAFLNYQVQHRHHHQHRHQQQLHKHKINRNEVMFDDDKLYNDILSRM